MNPHQKSPELLPPAAADRVAGVRLTQIHEEEHSSITNCPASSIYPKKKSALTSGATPRIEERMVLDNFAKTWTLHNPLTAEQLAFAGHEATVKSVGYYHGGDVLYVLHDVPGVWHEQCLKAATTSKP